MAPVLGLSLGGGLLLCWWSFWASHSRTTPGPLVQRLQDLTARAGLPGTRSKTILLCCCVAGVVPGGVILAGTGAMSLGILGAGVGFLLPLGWLRRMARKREARMRGHWPDAVDQLRSAIRAGLSLPEALIGLGSTGPEALRSEFRHFAGDYRSGGSFNGALDSLKVRLADPVGDRIVEALRLTRDVGGTDIGRLLGTLSGFLREDSRTRSELEARQSWTVNAAKLAVAAPWGILLLLSSRPEAMQAYAEPAGLVVLLAGLVISTGCYRVMLRIGALPAERRVLR